MFKLDNYKYPSTDLGLTALVQRPNDPTIRNWREGGYLKRVSNDPWGNPYQYVFPGTRGQEYDLYSFGADGQEGGEGDNADIGNWNLAVAACRARPRACARLHADRAHDRGVHHRPGDGRCVIISSAAIAATPNSKRKPSVSTPCSTTCASRRNCRRATTVSRQPDQLLLRGVRRARATSGAPRKKTMRCASGDFPRASSREWSSKAARSCSTRRRRNDRGLSAAGA